MCKRFSLFPDENLATRYDIPSSFNFNSRYNIAPGQDSPVVWNENNSHQITMMSWGITSGERNVINVRQETLENKRPFYDLMESGRCLIPVSAFYEWKSTKIGMIPYLFYQRNLPTFSLAGLWNQNEGDSQKEFAILTARASAGTSQIHNRMPLIIPKEFEKLWLEGSKYKALNQIRTPSKVELKIHQVSPNVNDPVNEGKNLIEPVSRLENWASRV